MGWRVTILCENSVGPLSGTLGEHGFAALVEGDGSTLLFDTGQGATLLHNSRRLNRDLRQVSAVALSHGHFDHTGGLLSLLEEAGPKMVYAHPGIFARRYRVKDTGESVSIGIPFTEEDLLGRGAAFTFSSRFGEIAAGMFLTGEVPRQTPFERGDSGLFCDEAGCIPDMIRDDQSLVLRSDRGLVLLLGCCHAGIVNTMEYVIQQTGIDEFYAVIGGTHLGFCGPAQLEETVKRLRQFRVAKIYGSHCTGFAASARLAHDLPGRFHPAHVGFTLEL